MELRGNVKYERKIFSYRSLSSSIGGVSIYIYRYSKFLEKQGEEVEFIDFDKMGRLEKFKFLMRYCLISPQKHTFHLNEFNTLTMIALLLRPFQCRIILQNHSIRILDNFRNIKNND